MGQKGALKSRSGASRVWVVEICGAMGCGGFAGIPNNAGMDVAAGPATHQPTSASCFASSAVVSSGGCSPGHASLSVLSMGSQPSIRLVGVKSGQTMGPIGWGRAWILFFLSSCVAVTNLQAATFQNNSDIFPFL